MKFEDVLPALREGKKITGSKNIKTNKYIYYKDGFIFDNEDGHMLLTIYDVVERDDWEIVEEEKKVKLRDLTLEQYKKWLKSNCDVRCNNCVFNKVDCFISNRTLWIKHKDLYSDKFLDQEVEIYE